MSTTKVCKMCGMEFEGNTNARYCSPRCRLDYQKVYQGRWRDANREHVREYQREYQRKYGFKYK